MNAALRRRLERAARVRDFIRAHKTDGTGEGTALARLEELLQRAEALAAQQRSGVVATRSDRKSTRLNSSHMSISYAVFCLKKKKTLVRHLAPLTMMQP